MRENFSNRFGVLVAVAGSAIGLGNLWRFPYIMGKHGGGAFILLYLLFVIVICLPIMYSEMVIGRRAQANAYGAFRRLAPGSLWTGAGVISILAPVVILGYYSVVGGWTLKYMQMALCGSFGRRENLDGLFGGFISSPGEPLLWHLGFLGLTALIVLGGIKNGIEKYSKILMPALFVMVILMAARAITLPGAGAGVEFLFRPDFSKLNGEVVLAAMGQAFFSLSLGMGAIITYGSYMKRKENIPRTSALVVATDTGFAILAGLAIMPAVFAFGIEPGQGPGLVFITVPKILAQLPLGGLFATVFFAILAVAALTSSISLLEVMTTFLSEEFRMGRKAAVAVSFGVIAVLGAVASLSFDPDMRLILFGKSAFDAMDYFASNILLPLGGLLIVLFTGWRMPRAELLEELSAGGGFRLGLFRAVRFLLRYVIPVAIAAILLGNVF